LQEAGVSGPPSYLADACAAIGSGLSMPSWKKQPIRLRRVISGACGIITRLSKEFGLELNISQPTGGIQSNPSLCEIVATRIPS